MNSIQNKYITYNEEALRKLKPEDALRLLKEGNDRFTKKKRIDRNYHDQITKTSSGQAPYAVVLSCIDSRVPTEIIFDQGIGDIFNIRIAGNVINEDILGSMEFACNLVGSKLIVVLGHTKCGAIKGAYKKASLGHLTGLLKKIKPAIDACSHSNDTEERIHLDNIAKENVEFVMDEIKEKSPVLSTMISDGSVKLVGGMYDVNDGKVTFAE